MGGGLDFFVLPLLGDAWIDRLRRHRRCTAERHLADLRARSGLTTEQLIYRGRAEGRLVVPSLEVARSIEPTYPAPKRGDQAHDGTAMSRRRLCWSLIRRGWIVRNDAGPEADRAERAAPDRYYEAAGSERRRHRERSHALAAVRDAA